MPRVIVTVREVVELVYEVPLEVTNAGAAEDEVLEAAECGTYASARARAFEQWNTEETPPLSVSVLSVEEEEGNGNA